MRLCPTLYHLKLVNKKTPDEDLLLVPILFTTVYNQQVGFVWHLRKLVFRLKLYDLIAYQLKEWQIAHKLNEKDTLFYSGCKDILPVAELEQDILLLFGKIKQDKPAKNTFFKYESDVEEFEDKLLRRQLENDEEVNELKSRKQSEHNSEQATSICQDSVVISPEITSDTKSQISTQDTEPQAIILDAVPPSQPESIVAILATAHYQNLDPETPISSLIPHMLTKRPPLTDTTERELELHKTQSNMLRWVPRSLKRHGQDSRIRFAYWCEQQAKSGKAIQHKSKH